jgi:hypothetical protein
MTYGCEPSPCGMRTLDGAVVSHMAELVRGYYEGPLIRPFGAPSPQGEKGFARLSRELVGTAGGRK